MAKSLDLAALEKELPSEGVARVLFEEVKRLRNVTVTASEPKSKLTKRAVAMLKDHDLFADLHTTRCCISSALSALSWRRDRCPHISDIFRGLKAFREAVETAESRLIEEHQDA